MTEIIHGDCMDVLPFLASDSFDSCVTDPPYNLESIKKRFGADGAKEARAKQTGVYARQSKGFMGKTWDSDVAFQPAMWAEVFRVLKPGAHVLAFGGSRTYHRLASAIEDAGFEIRDQIMWLYGSGFPKSHNLDGEWEGWGTALKPAHEPIVMARKPLTGTVAQNVSQWGVGAINIDGCRVGADGGTKRSGQAEYPKKPDGTEDRSGTWARTGHDIVELDSGRFPANVIHDGSGEVLSGFPETAPARRGRRNPPKATGILGAFAGDDAERFGYEDEGSAARFFYCAKASRADRNDGLAEFKAVFRVNGNKWTDQDYRVARGERPPSAETGPRKNPHPTVKPTDLMRYLCRLVTPPGGHVLDPFLGSGSTGRGAVLEGFEFTGIELTAEYVPIARARIAAVEPQGVFA